MPLQKHPSATVLRKMDGLRQHRPATSENRPQAQYNESFFDRILPPIGKNDPAEHRMWPSRQSSSGRSMPQTQTPRTRSIAATAGRSASIDQNEDGTSHDPIPIRHPAPQQNLPSRDIRASRSTSPASRKSSELNNGTPASSIELPPLQVRVATEETDKMQPTGGDLVESYDLVTPAEAGHRSYSLENRSCLLFSRRHLEIIFSQPSSLLRFTSFLGAHRPKSVPILVYYLDATKALKAIQYANAVSEALKAIDGLGFTAQETQITINNDLEEKAAAAFDVLVEQDLPAFITQIYIQVVSLSISKRITGTLPPHLREASEGLAEVFCLTDPSRPDNPIVFASEEFNRTTQYGLNYVIGRNCRFLQGPLTNRHSPQRLGDAIRSGKEHCEVFLNYRRDGSPFMNLLMTAPLCDSKGKIRYFIGAQVDVSGLVKDCTDLDSFQQLIEEDTTGQIIQKDGSDSEIGAFRDLSKMLNMTELETVKKHGGGMHREYQEDDIEQSRNSGPQMPRLLLQEPAADTPHSSYAQRQSGKLSGIYQNYLLVRPYPSFRILFASPSLRVPGILQSPFMDRIGGSSRVRDELSSALAEGRGVTAKVRWVTKVDEEGRNRWIHCTPLIGSNGQIGVWMIVLVDDEMEANRRWKQAPPVILPTRTKTESSTPHASDTQSNYVRVDDRTTLASQHLSADAHSIHRSATPDSVVI